MQFLKMGKRLGQTFQKGRYTKGKAAHGKVFNIISQLGDYKQKNNEIPIHA